MNNLAVINSVSVEFSIVGDEVFEKRHTDVLRAIEKLPSDEFKSENFKSSTYLDTQMKPRPCYNLTRDGFSLLVMGFTGQKAYQWKIEFIKAFNTMEAKLKRQSISHYVDKIASLEAVRISQNDHHHRQINGYKSQISQHNTQILGYKSQISQKNSEILALKQQILREKKNEEAVILLGRANKKISEAYIEIQSIMANLCGDVFFKNKF